MAHRRNLSNFRRGGGSNRTGNVRRVVKTPPPLTASKSLALVLVAIVASLAAAIAVAVSSLPSFALTVNQVASPLAQIRYPLFYDSSKFTMSNADLTLNSNFTTAYLSDWGVTNNSRDNDTIALKFDKVRTNTTYSNPFTMRFKNVGYTSDGTYLDFEIKCTSLKVGNISKVAQKGGATEGNVHHDYLNFFGIRKKIIGNQQPFIFIGGVCSNAGNGTWATQYEVSVSCTYSFYKTGSNTKYNKPISFYYEDLDMPGSGNVGAFDNPYDLSPEYNESIQLNNGFGPVYVQRGHVLSITSNGTKFTATPAAADVGSGEVELASLATTITGSGSVTFWGCSCFSGAGLAPVGYAQYPEWEKPTKAVSHGGTYDLGDTVTYTMSVDVPYVNNSLQPNRIAFYDTLHNIFDPSSVRLVSVTCEGRDVTSGWDLTTSGQTVTVSTTNTSKSNAMGTIKATFTVKIKDDYDISSLPANDDGTVTIPNGVTVRIDDDEETGPDESIDINGAPTMSLEKTAVTKGVHGEDVKVGAPVQFEIAVTNESKTQTISNVSIDDELADCTVDYGTWTAPRSLGPGETKTVKANYELKLEDILAGKVVNWASANGTWNDDTVKSNRDDAEVPIDNAPALTLEKTPKTQKVEGTDVEIGKEVTWQIKVTNSGNVPLTNVVVNDKLDGTTVTPTDPVDLAVGESETYQVSYKLTKQDILDGTVTNVAVATGDWVGGTPVESNEDTAVVEIDNDPALTLEKSPKTQTVPDEDAVPGHEVSWQIKVTNTGNVKVTDITIDESALPGCTVAPTSPVTLNPGQSTAWTATYDLTQEDIDALKVHNVAIANGLWLEDQPIQSNDDFADVTIDVKPHISIDKTVEEEVVPIEDAHPGTVIHYGFTVTNDGRLTLSETQIVDQLPNIKNLTIDWTTSTDPDTGDGVLAPTETVSATATYTLTQADIDRTTVTNTAHATGKDPQDNDVQSEPDEVVTTIEYKDDLTVEKTVDKEVIEGDEIVPGTLLTYTIVITNTGNRTVTDVTLEDKLEGIDGPVIDWSTSTDETTGEGTLIPGESVTATATYTLTQHDIDMAEVINVVIAHGKNPDGDPVDSDPDDAKTIIDVHDELVLEKSVDKTELRDDEMFVGQTLNYSFVLTNNGDRTVHDVEFEDYLHGLSDITVDWEGSSDPETEAGTLSPDEIVTATATYAITQNDIDNCQVTNTAIVHSKLPNEDPLDSNESTVTTIIDANAEFIIEKQVDKTELTGDDAVPGTTLNYTFHLTNNGDRTIRNVELDDYLDGVYDIAIDWDSSTDETTGEGTLSPGEMVDATGKYDITQADIDTGKVVNTVIAHGTLGGEYDPNQKPDDEPTDGEETPDDGTGEETPGDGTGDTPGEDETPDEGDGDGSGDDIVAEPDTDGDGAPDADEPAADVERIDSNESTVETVIERNPHLSLTKVADRAEIDPAYPGDKINYSFTVTNDGNVTLRNVTIDDDLIGISELVYDWSGTAAGDGTLAPGETSTATAEYMITQQDLDAGEVVNTATAHGAAPDNSDIASDPAEAATTLVDGNSEVTTDGNSGVTSDLISTESLIQAGAVAGAGIAAVTGVAGVAFAVSRALRKRK